MHIGHSRNQFRTHLAMEPLVDLLFCGWIEGCLDAHDPTGISVVERSIVLRFEAWVGNPNQLQDVASP